MDLQKDNQKDKKFSALQYDPNLFHNDQQFYLAYRKIDHIVSAVFLVTGLIEKNDFLKNSIQEHSLNSLSRVVTLIGKPGVGVSDIQLVAAHLLHLNSLIDIGFWAGQISQMNLTIIQKEVRETYEILNELSLKYKNSFFIDSSFFKTDNELLNDLNIKDKHKDISQRQDSIKDIDKGQRKEAILALLRQKTNLTVKDFASVVPEYSEKTIQRELIALVEEGVVRKEGERRWSSYSLAT